MASASATTFKPLVLVTGLSGYCAASIAVHFLEAGYRVRGTVRRQAQADAWAAHYPQWHDCLEPVVVPDLGLPGACDSACEGVEVVVHPASPFFYGYTDNERDMLLPAVRGTLGVLESSHKAGTVRQVVVTSSFAAMQDYHQGEAHDYTYSERDWCPLTWDEAKTSKDQTLVYVASKKFAEEAAWKFVEERKPGFSLTTILPTFIIGRSVQPIKSAADLSVSAGWIRSLLDASEVPAAPIPAMVSVSDVALAHLRAVERSDVAAGQRYFLVGDEFTGAAAVRAARRVFPKLAEEGRFPEPADESEEKMHWRWDVSKTERELGIEWMSLEQTVKEALEQVLELQG
ncbi:hypothetical protein JCM10207_004853 [Rhodosporidiobolus poonsookiae]